MKLSEMLARARSMGTKPKAIVQKRGLYTTPIVVDRGHWVNPATVRAKRTRRRVMAWKARWGR